MAAAGVTRSIVTPQVVLRDVRDHVVSVEAAATDYGVVITDNGRSVDLAATEALRGQA